MGHRIGLLAVGIVVALAFVAGGAAAEELATKEMPVPKITLYPGDVIRADTIFERLFVARTVAQAVYHEKRDSLIGKVARKTLLKGQPIALSAVRDPDLVTQGQPAPVIFKSGGLVITASAVALQSGGAGDIIALRNPDSGNVIKGTVQTDGTVSVSEQ